MAATLIIFSVALLSVTTTKFVLGVTTTPPLYQSFSPMRQSANWISEYSANGNIVTSLHTAGLLFFSVVEADKGGHVIVFFSQFAQVVDFLMYQNSTNVVDTYFDRMGFEYVLIPTEIQSSTTAFGAWAIVGRAPPLGESTYHFDNLSIFNKIYDDGNGIVYDHRAR